MPKKNTTQFFIDLKAKLEKARKGRDEAQGELNGIMKTLKDEFDVKSKADLEEMIQELEKEYDVLDKKIDKMVAKLKKEFGDE